MRTSVRVVVLLTMVVGTGEAGGQATSPAGTQPVASQPAGLGSGQALLRQDFEAEKGNWSGRIVTDNVPPGSERALAAVANETHWARRATVTQRMQAADKTVLRLRYFISKDIPLTIYIFDRTQKDNLRYDVKEPVVGKWTEVRVNINVEFRRNDGSAGRLAAGDQLSGISFLAGKTGVDEFELVVEDVEVVGGGR